jgi:hypothetical protein
MRGTLFTASLLLMAALGAPVLNDLNAQSELVPNATLVIRSGFVEVQRGNGWQPVSSGETLNTGDRIRTGRGSMAAVELGPSRIITIHELSQVLIGRASAPVAQLEMGTMKVMPSSNMPVSAPDTALENRRRPVDLQPRFEADTPKVRVFSGDERRGPMVDEEDSRVRTYTAGRRSPVGYRNSFESPAYYVYPYIVAPPNFGGTVPPVVIQPVHPAFRPTQIVPPMTDPIRVPIMTEPARVPVMRR